MLKKSIIYLGIQVVGQGFVYYLANASGNPWGTEMYGELAVGVFFCTAAFGCLVFIPGSP